jgi:hypothetical protein
MSSGAAGPADAGGAWRQRGRPAGRGPAGRRAGQGQRGHRGEPAGQRVHGGTPHRHVRIRGAAGRLPAPAGTGRERGGARRHRAGRGLGCGGHRHLGGPRRRRPPAGAPVGGDGPNTTRLWPLGASSMPQSRSSAAQAISRNRRWPGITATSACCASAAEPTKSSWRSSAASSHHDGLPGDRHHLPRRRGRISHAARQGQRPGYLVLEARARGHRARLVLGVELTPVGRTPSRCARRQLAHGCLSDPRSLRAWVAWVMV